MKRFIILILLPALFTAQASAQRRTPRGEAGGQFMFYETLNMPDSVAGRSRVDILYRIDRQFFVAVRNADSTVHWPFIRQGEVSVDLIDSAGVSRARDIERVFMGERSEEPDPSVRTWYQGMTSLSVAPGTYTVALEITDLESKRDIVDRARKVEAEAFGREAFNVSSPLFVEGNPPPALPDTILAVNYGNDFLWSSQGCLFLMLGGNALKDSAVEVRYTLAVASSTEDSSPPVQSETSRSVTPLRGFQMIPLEAGEKVGYTLVRNGSHAPACLFIGFRSDTLLLRDYRLEVTVSQGKMEKSIVRRFRMVWPDMPLSLRNVDNALDALRYITTQNQLDSLKSGNYEARRDHLEAFWRAQAAVGGLGRNAVMIQYYRRVDFADRQFATIRQPDGSRSDRGRVFILYGPPTRTERMLDPGLGFTEVWTYDRLNTKFTFRDPSKTGDYSLIATAP